MNLLQILLIVFLMPMSANAGNFQEAIKRNHFYVKPSNNNIADLREASTLVISCVDFRLRDEIERFLREELYLLDDYDEVALPGASLAFVQTKYKNWSKTIEDVVALLTSLHHIKQVIFVDHLQCGAYKLLHAQDTTKSRDLELVAHKQTLSKAKQMMKKKFPDLEVFSFIMDLDGNIEQVKE